MNVGDRVQVYEPHSKRHGWLATVTHTVEEAESKKRYGGQCCYVRYDNDNSQELRACWSLIAVEAA